MASLICPDCHYRFRLPESLGPGDDATCPACEAQIEIAQESDPETSSSEVYRREKVNSPNRKAPRGERYDDDDDEDRLIRSSKARSSPRLGNRKAYGKVATGFLLNYYGLILSMAAFLIFILGTTLISILVVGGGKFFAGIALAFVMMLLIGILSLIGEVLRLIGCIYCLNTPDRASSAKTLVICALIFEVLAILGSVTSAVAAFGGVPRGAGALQGLMGFVATILFLLFTRSLAIHIRRHDLAAVVIVIIWLIVATTIVSMVGFGFMILGGVAAFAGGDKDSVILLVIIGLVFGILVLVLIVATMIRAAKLMMDMSHALKALS